jgi:hypothetical protein
MEEKYVELMNREIDGLNSRKESAELQEYLRRNPEAERYYRELLFVAGVLDRVPDVEPPAELKASIMRAIFGEEAGVPAEAGEIRATAGAAVTAGAGARAERERRPASILDLFRIRWEPRFAYVLAACIGVGLFLFVLFWRVVPGRAPRELEGLYGSIVSSQEVGQLLAVQPVRFALLGTHGELHIRYEPKRILVALDLRSDSRIQVVFDYSKDVSLESITALNKCEYNAKAGDGKFELTHSGDCRYVIVLQDGSGTHSPITLKVIRGDALLLEETARPARD